MEKNLEVLEETFHFPVTSNLADYAGAGTEEATAADYSIPTLSLVQKMSGVLDDTSPNYNEAARPGDIYESVSGHFYSGKNGIKVIPVYFRKEFVEWTPREAGGGFAGVHKPTDPIVATGVRNDRGQLILPNGNYLAETARHYIIVNDPDDAYQAVINMTSTQLRTSRRWLAIIGTRPLVTARGKISAPSFAFQYQLTSATLKNDQGSWSGWNVELIGPTPDALIPDAIAFYKAIRGGAIQQLVPSEELMDQDQVPF